MLYIRADGNPQIGVGHTMRCLSIAHALRLQGEESVFITADAKTKPLLEEQGFSVICLNSVWNDLERETEQMEALIKRESIRVLLIDSYFATEAYLKRLQYLTQVVCMDDLNDFVRPCSMLINYNLYATGWNYEDRYPDTTLLLGPNYTPLRGEFQRMPKHTASTQVKNVLITTGGSDPFNVAGEFIQAAKGNPKTAALTYHVVAGQFNQHLSMLEGLANTHSGVILHRNVTQMSELMCACDLAISAAGSTLYELSASGTPTICFASADNQLPGLAAFGNSCMISVGDVRNRMDTVIVKMVNAVETLRENTLHRQKMADSMQTIVDGQGATRIADHLLRKLCVP